MSFYHWLGREAEGLYWIDDIGAEEMVPVASYVYHGNWDFSDPICRAQPGKFLPFGDKTGENCRAEYLASMVPVYGFPKA